MMQLQRAISSQPTAVSKTPAEGRRFSLAADCWPRAAAPRRGITLLEVLISMFVMLVGLLGVLSLIPVGRFQQQRGAKIDRASATGRAGFRDMQVRAMLNPRSWALADGLPVANLNTATPVFTFDGATMSAASRIPLPGVPAFCLDPLGVSANLGPWFPYTPTPSGSPPWPVPQASPLDTPPTPPMPDAPLRPRLPRITLGPNLAASARAALADAVFRGQDDLTFDTPNNADLLPSQVLQGTNVRRLSQGDYSWFATVVPDPSLTNMLNSFDVPYIVSVAVYNKRVLNPGLSGERVCKLDPAVGNVQDEVRLQLATADVATQYAGDGKAHLDVKPGQWIMLAGGIDTDADSVLDRWHFRWHRIATADETQVIGTGWSRNLTLMGPFPDNNTIAFDWNNVTAFLFDGVIAVYEKNMKLELDSIY